MRYFLIAIAVIALVISIVFVKMTGFDNEHNIEQRKEYWTQKISSELPPSPSKEQLQQFARNNGQTLSCYQNYEKEDVCSFDDNQSSGGTENLPMVLAVIFTMQDDKAVSHQLVTASKSSE